MKRKSRISFRILSSDLLSDLAVFGADIRLALESLKVHLIFLILTQLFDSSWEGSFVDSFAFGELAQEGY